MCDFGLVKGGTFWIILIILLHELWEKTILVSGGLTSYFVNDIRVKKSLYKGLRFGGSLSLSRKKSSCF